jgi:hypothetical protein
METEGNDCWHVCGFNEKMSRTYLICPSRMEKSALEKEVLKIVSHDHHSHGKQ